MRLASFPLALLVAGIAPSQTYVVDAAGGPGANFTSIAAAVAVVPDGAVLLVRAGTYTQFTINNKGLTVLADPGVAVDSMVIQNTTATQPVVLRNLVMNWSIGCTSCLGPVLLDQFSPGTGVNNLTVTGCTQVIATTSYFRGSASPSQQAVRAISSKLVLVNCTCYAGGTYAQTMYVVGSRVQLVSSTVQASGSGYVMAITADTASDLRLLGTTLVSGPAGTTNYGIAGNPTVRRASTVTVTGTAPPMVTVDDESLSGAGGAVGGSVGVTLKGANGNIAVLVLGITGSPLFVPGIIDPWWLDPGVWAPVAVAVLSGPLTATVAIPPTPALQGELFGFQGLYLAPTGLSVSNPYRFVIQ